MDHSPGLRDGVLSVDRCALPILPEVRGELQNARGFLSRNKHGRSEVLQVIRDCEQNLL
jgi:hypothetical protein